MSFLEKEDVHELPKYTEKLCESDTSDTLFLSRRKLKNVESIFKNTNIKNLYLEGNEISCLPDCMFTSLPKLIWLDLRNNQITAIPAAIGLHRCLKSLLLEGNPISELPAELGNVITLRALNIRHCPIRFPPQEIIHQGLQCILQYLRSTLAQRAVTASTCDADKTKPNNDVPPVEKLQLSELVQCSTELCGEVVDEEELQRFRELKEMIILMDRAELASGAHAVHFVYPPRTMQGAMHDGNHQFMSMKRVKEIFKATMPPEHRVVVSLPAKRSQERRLAAMKALKEKQDMIEQKRKDKDLLQEWRTQAKNMQEKKILEYKQKQYERQTKDEEPDRSAQTLQRSFMSPEEREKARAALDRELEERVRQHIRRMQERSKNPMGTVTEEKTAAVQDLNELSKLQAEVLDRKRGRDAEYRFTAFTGDT